MPPQDIIDVAKWCAPPLSVLPINCSSVRQTRLPQTCPHSSNHVFPAACLRGSTQGKPGKLRDILIGSWGRLSASGPSAPTRLCAKVVCCILRAAVLTPADRAAVRVAVLAGEPAEGTPCRTLLNSLFRCANPVPLSSTGAAGLGPKLSQSGSPARKCRRRHTIPLVL